MTITPRTRLMVAAAAVTAVVGLTVGCSDEKASRRAGSETEAEEAAEPASSVPKPLTTIEAQAEDIIDVVPGGRWEKVANDVEKTASAWNGYRAQAARDGADTALLGRFDAALASLRAAAGANNAAETMQSANNLSAVVIDLFGLYHPVVPLDVGRFDVVGRQVILDVDRRDFAAAGAQIDRISTTWGTLKGDIAAHKGGARVVTETEALLAAMRDAQQRGDASTLKRKTADFLEVVDSMEQLYERA